MPGSHHVAWGILLEVICIALLVVNVLLEAWLWALGCLLTAPALALVVYHDHSVDAQRRGREPEVTAHGRPRR